MFPAINQFHDGTAVGDAVTNDMFEIKAALQRNGFRSDIYATHVSPDLQGRIHTLDSYRGVPDGLLIVHHSMGFDRMEQVVGLPDRKILRYHNITPPEFLSSGYARAYAAKGRAQLADYREDIEIALGDSEYNRRELVEIGFRYTSVLPIFYRPAALLDEPLDTALVRKLKKTYNLLFVGRIALNKRQIDLVRIFEQYRHRHNENSHLWLVGSWNGAEEYRDEVLAEIAQRGLSSHVTLTGKISSSQLATYYRHSDVLLCASEHEGFCVPLLEAMGFDLPLIAFGASAIPETLGPAGIVLESRTPELWCAVIEELRNNPHFRGDVIARGRSRLSELSLANAEIKLLEIVRGLSTCSPIDIRKPSLQVQGPFETSYSLAEVNRNLAIALDKSGRYDISIYCTEGPGDYAPKEADLVDKPGAKWLWQKSAMLTGTPDVVIRNLYPPRVHDVNGKLNLLYLAWEDSLLPTEWASEFNRNVNLVLAPSHHVKQVMVDSGVTIPVRVVGEGISERFFDSKTTRPDKRKSNVFTFLNISSGFPRKGVDALVEAYFAEFTGADNVRLIIKTFPNPHNEVPAQIDAARRRNPNPPACTHIDRDLSTEEIDRLYAEADCLVYPTRAEGFGLPIAEAMACRVPVIVTRFSGPMDFCSERNAFLLDYDLAPSRSHLAIPGAMWAEPRIDQLREQMRFVFANRNSREVQRRVEAAYQNVRENLRWSRVANQVERVIASSLNKPAHRLAIVTTWDSRCGIAEYSRYFIEALREQQNEFEIEVLSSSVENIWPKNGIVNTVCWEQRPSTDLGRLQTQLLEKRFDIVHFQFNFGFFELKPFAELIEKLKRAGKKVVITFHSTEDVPEANRIISLKDIDRSLGAVDLLLVHGPADEKRLAEFGLKDNVRILPHGNVIYPIEDRSLRKQWGIKLDPVIGTFGFLLPNKGVLELLEAVKILRHEFPNLGLMAQCALHQHGISGEFEKVVRRRVTELELQDAVLLSTEFVTPEEAVLFLQLSDVVVMPYKETRESASGSVRFALASGRPVVTTKSTIFQDIDRTVFQTESAAPNDLASGILTVLNTPPVGERIVRNARSYVEGTHWTMIAKTYTQLIFSN